MKFFFSLSILFYGGNSLYYGSNSLYVGNSVHNPSALRAVPPHSERYFVPSLVGRLGKRPLIGRPASPGRGEIDFALRCRGRDHTYP